MKSTTYTFTEKIWLYPGQNAAWHFVDVPKKNSEIIKDKFGTEAKGWGSLPVAVTIGKTSWKTSIFPDRKSGKYILPIKSKVRTAEQVFEGDTVLVKINILV